MSMWGPLSIPMPEGPALLLEDVGKSFPGGVTALRDIGMGVMAGELVGLVGANGSGKSTLLRVMAGLLAPDAGKAMVLGMDPYPRDATLRRRTTWIPQETTLDGEMTGRETLGLFHALHGLPGAGRECALDTLARSFGLEHHLDRRVAAYSGGLKRRLHLALGWIRETQVLFADEPTAALDPVGRERVWSALADRADKGAVLVAATHDLAEAARYCHRVGLLDAGELKVLDTPERIIARYGAATLKLALRSTLPDPDAMKAGLEAVHGVARVERQPGCILLVGLNRGAGLNPDLLTYLLEHRGGIESFQFREADLAGAYFDLTGRPLMDTIGVPAERGGGKRGRERRRG